MSRRSRSANQPIMNVAAAGHEIRFPIGRTKLTPESFLFLSRLHLPSYLLQALGALTAGVLQPRRGLSAARRCLRSHSAVCVTTIFAAS